MKHLNRWVYAIVGVVVLLFAGLVYAWSVLSTPIAAQFPAWTKAQLSLTFTLVMIFFCIGSLLCGLLVGKLSAKVTIWVSALLFLMGFLLASRAQSLIMLHLSFGLMCGLGSGLSYNAVMSTMVRRFPDQPGLISGVLLMGFGGGSFLIGKLYQAWTPVDIGGWRQSFAVMGIVIAAVLVVCSFFFVTPDDSATVKSSTAVSTAVDSAPGKTLKTPTFWIYYIWAIVTSAAGLALISQASGVTLEANTSVAASSVATIVGLISIFNAVGRVLFGGIYDRFGRSLSMQGVNGLFILTSLILMVALRQKSVLLVIIGFIVGGLAYSGITPTNSAFVRAYYGPRYYPINLPLVTSNLIIASFGSTVSGALFDRSGSYHATFFLIIALALVGIACSLLISLLDRRAGKQV